MNTTPTAIPSIIRGEDSFPEIWVAVDAARRSCYRSPTSWFRRHDSGNLQYLDSKEYSTNGGGSDPQDAETVLRLTREMVAFEQATVIPKTLAVCQAWGVNLITPEEKWDEIHCRQQRHMVSQKIDPGYAWVDWYNSRNGDYEMRGTSYGGDPLFRKLFVHRRPKAEIDSELSRSYRRGRIDPTEFASIIKLSRELGGGSLNAIKPWRDQDGGTCIAEGTKVWLLPAGAQHERWLVHKEDDKNPYTQEVTAPVAAWKTAHRTDNGPGWNYTTISAEVTEGPYKGATLGCISAGAHYENRLIFGGKIIGWGMRLPWDKVPTPNRPEAPYTGGEICNLNNRGGQSSSADGEEWRGEVKLLLFPPPFPVEKLMALPKLTDEEIDAILGVAVED